jgi:chaperonin GroEL
VQKLIDELNIQLSVANTPAEVIRLEKRLARLSAKVAVVKVGAGSDLELKEKADRVEDAICATKAAIKEGIVPGGGIALLDASNKITATNKGGLALLEAIKGPFKTILTNAGIDIPDLKLKRLDGHGLNAVTGEQVNMIEAGIIDPLSVTKSALRNAASVAITILSTDCVINNMRQVDGKL